MTHNEAKQPTKFFGLSRNVLSMSAVSFLNDLASDMVFPFIPIFLTSVLGATATIVGVIEGIADATASVVRIVSGRLSDHWRRRKPFVTFGYALSALTKPLLALATAPWHVLAVRFFDRVGKGVREAPRDALVSFSTEQRDVGRAFGFHRASDTMGAALGPLLAFAILPLIENDLRTLFLFSFVASFLSVLVVQLCVREVRTEEHRDVEMVDGAVAVVEPPRRPRLLDLRALGAPFLIFVAAATIFSLGKSSAAFLLLRAEDAGVALAFLPIIYFVYNIVFALASTPIGIFSDTFGHRNTFMLGMLVFSATYVGFALAESVSAVWILFAVYGIFSALTEGVGRAIVADLVPERHRGTAFGIYNAFTGIALLPASIIFGLLWDASGYAAAFYFGAAMGIIALVIFVIFRFMNPTFLVRLRQRS